MSDKRVKIDLLVHDLKGPLAIVETGIKSLIQKKDKYGSLTELQLKVLKRVLRNTLATKTLVNDALELGRSREGVSQKTNFILSDLIKNALLEIFDLTDHDTSELIKECDDLLRIKDILLAKGIGIEIPDELWCRELCLDESKIKQIVRNLLSNAIKYRKDKVFLIISESERDKSLILSVKDDGEGIPEKYHEKIFECYFQMDAGTDHCVRGHGLGLAGVMILIEDMGGQLVLNSDAGQGADFSVKIPLS